MLLKLGKESMDVRGEHAFAYLTALIVAMIIWAVFLNITVLAFSVPYTQLLSGLGSLGAGVLAYIVYRLHPKFSSADRIAVATFGLLSLLCLVVLLYGLAFALDRLPASEIGPGFWVFPLSLPFGTVFFYIALVFFYEKLHARMHFYALGYALGLALLTPLIEAIVAYSSAGIFFLQDSPAALLMGILDRSFFAYFCLAYIISRKGRLHELVYASVLLAFLAKGITMLVVEATLDILAYPLFVVLTYFAGRWLSEKPPS